jgi:hypothetical protein
VRDAHGALAAGLTKDDFEVFEDTAPQNISFFARSSASLSMRVAARSISSSNITTKVDLDTTLELPEYLKHEEKWGVS